jgi:hypothetical protein
LELGLDAACFRYYMTMVHATGPTAHNKKSADATLNGSKPVRTRNQTAPKSKTPMLPPTKICVRKSVLEQLDAAYQPSTSGKIVIPKCTITRMGSAEQLEMDLDEEADELEGDMCCATKLLAHYCFFVVLQ